MPEERYRHAVEMYMVLSECMWVLHASTVYHSREGLTGVLRENREIERAGQMEIEWWGWDLDGVIDGSGWRLHIDYMARGLLDDS